MPIVPQELINGLIWPDFFGGSWVELEGGARSKATSIPMILLNDEISQ